MIDTTLYDKGGLRVAINPAQVSTVEDHDNYIIVVMSNGAEFKCATPYLEMLNRIEKGAP